MTTSGEVLKLSESLQILFETRIIVCADHFQDKFKFFEVMEPKFMYFIPRPNVAKLIKITHTVINWAGIAQSV